MNILKSYLKDQMVSKGDKTKQLNFYLAMQHEFKIQIALYTHLRQLTTESERCKNGLSTWGSTVVKTVVTVVKP